MIPHFAFYKMPLSGKNLGRKLLIVVAILTSNIFLCSHAFAEEICKFLEVIPGTLQPQGSPLPTRLLSSNSPEFSGSVTVDCGTNADAQLTVVSLTPTAETPTNGNAVATVTIINSSISTSSNGTPLYLPAGVTTLNIDVIVDNATAPLRAGTYQYNVELRVESKTKVD